MTSVHLRGPYFRLGVGIIGDRTSTFYLKSNYWRGIGFMLSNYYKGHGAVLPDGITKLMNESLKYEVVPQRDFFGFFMNFSRQLSRKLNDEKIWFRLDLDRFFMPSKIG